MHPRCKSFVKYMYVNNFSVRQLIFLMMSSDDAEDFNSDVV